ncbi:flagellar basal body-associated protein FliL [Glaciecola petra]|uniref:Flagellar protein FliL n=1 Tax=Glaciecola petra TaxID=3075602 RepID=A0ABU2ZUX7_9ALTE|nr:flagellar basal body-associated protein FliL [Aestuariibacter sp. P117]MDT0596445.1 flagellar basal body-associated protein FliL [Aestuariibacter sp. P117]
MAYHFPTSRNQQSFIAKLCSVFTNTLRRGKLFGAILISVGLLISTNAHAQEESSESPSYVYIALDPEIITNYAGDNSQRLGYLRIAVEMMLENPNDLMDIEHHMPLLRSIAIEVIGTQTEQQVKSLTGRENMRREILSKFRDSLIKETNKEIIRDIIFTKYLRQGG